MSLPKPSSDSAYVDVTIVLGGSLEMPEYFINKDGSKSNITLPDYAFIIQHKKLQKNILFDVGLEKVLVPV